MDKKNKENLTRVSNLLNDLISDEVEERTSELEENLSHFKCLSARYRDLIKFLVRESKLEFRNAKEHDDRNSYFAYTSYTNQKGYVYEQYEMIKKICDNRA